MTNAQTEPAVLNESVRPYEKEVIAIVEEMEAAGLTISAVYDGGEVVSVAEESAVETVLSVGESTIYAKDAGGKKLCVFIVLGNEDGVAICDYTDHPILDKISASIYERFSK